MSLSNITCEDKTSDHLTGWNAKNIGKESLQKQSSVTSAKTLINKTGSIAKATRL